MYIKTINAWNVSTIMLLATAVILMPEMANAGTSIATVLCNVVEWFTGPVGQGIATLAIIVIGVGALLGKVSWGMAIIVGIGVAVIFGAESLVRELSTGVSTQNCI